MSAPTRVLVVDDQFLIRAGLIGVLGSVASFDVVGEAGDGEQAVRLAGELRPDVILMDIQMPGLNGIEATKRILANPAAPAARVLMLTTFDLDEYVYGALRAGAAGFLLKDSGPERLLTAVTAIKAGDALFAPSVTRRLVEAFARQSGSQSDGARPPDLRALTSREVEVLTLVARGLSNLEIAERLYLSEATIKTHLNRMMAKLDLGSRAQAVVVAYETGLVMPGT
jgi:DNA-binding NarL/FixJ family response regulator